MRLRDAEGVGLLRLPGKRCLKLAVGLQLRQESRHGARVVAGTRKIAAAQPVGLELLLARIAAHQQRTEGAARPRCRTAEQNPEDTPGALGDIGEPPVWERGSP